MEEPGESYEFSATESAKEFARFLDEQFAENRPFDGGEGEDLYRDSRFPREQEESALHWHNMIRDHTSSKPMLPRSTPVGLPRMDTTGGSTRGHTRSSTGGGGGGGSSRANDSNRRNDTGSFGDDGGGGGGGGMSGILNAGKQGSSYQPPRQSRVVKSASMAALCKDGWTIGKGWDNRPKASQINPVAVADDISRVRARLERARGDLKPRTTTSSRLEPKCWPEAQGNTHGRTIFANVSRNRMQSPGPKYNLQPQLARSGGSIPRQLDYYTCKDVSFSCAPRMVGERPRSPGPIYDPADGRAKLLPPKVVRPPPARYSSGVTKIGTSGRDFLGSIYYDQYNCPSPGGIYNSNVASRVVSTTIPVVTPTFAPTNKNTPTDMRLRNAADNLNPLLRGPLRRHHRSRGGSRVDSCGSERGDDDDDAGDNEYE